MSAEQLMATAIGIEAIQNLSASNQIKSLGIVFLTVTSFCFLICNFQSVIAIPRRGGDRMSHETFSGSAWNFRRIPYRASVPDKETGIYRE